MARCPELVGFRADARPSGSGWWWQRREKYTHTHTLSLVIHVGAHSSPTACLQLAYSLPTACQQLADAYSVGDPLFYWRWVGDDCHTVGACTHTERHAPPFLTLAVFVPILQVALGRELYLSADPNSVPQPPSAAASGVGVAVDNSLSP